MTSRSIKDIIKTLQAQFTAPKPPLSLPPECRRILQNFVEEHYDDVSDESSARANAELKSFWERYVGDSPQKLGAFAGVLRELRPAIIGEANILDWWQLVLRPVITSGSGYKKASVEDAREFLLGTMVREDEGEVASGDAAPAGRLCTDLLTIYITRTRPVTDEHDEAAAAENSQVAQQVEDILVAFGRKRPKDLFHRLDDLVDVASTRLQALTLLSSFLRHQTPHLYLVINTPLVEHLLKCLMNDTSTTILSVALTSLIMLLPHIPGSLGPYLPRLFLVYSRLLCWEKFSPLSSEADRNLVTDDRIANDDDDSDEGGPRDVGIDQNWDKVQPGDDMIEAATPELMTYFTYLYGLYPLNLMSYIRKPRRYLKNVEFPGAYAFDLDQAVIRSRTEQYRQVHLLHPNFYNMTADEELVDPKWPKMDPADVVGQCHGRCIVNSKPSLTNHEPPTGKLPDISPAPPLIVPNAGVTGHLTPSVSHASLRSGTSGRDTQASTADGESPLLKPRRPQSEEDVLPDHLRRPIIQATGAAQPLPSPESSSHQGLSNRSITSVPKEKPDAAPQTNLAYLQQELTLLRNNLNFERWHKAQYSEHIGQIMRRNVKEATVEAETLNLINANRALKKQLDQVRKARENTAKDSALTRKQANNLEANMSERFHKFKLEQETWQADSDELSRLRAETSQYRELLVATEARELNKSHQLEVARRDLEQLEALQAQLQNAKRRLHEYEYREFEFDNARRQTEILRGENQILLVKIERHEQEYARLRQAYASKVTELETQLATDSTSRSAGSQSGPDVRAVVQQAIAESQAKLTQLKLAHSKLLERHTDLELEYHSVKSRLDALQGTNSGQTFFRKDSDADMFGYDIVSDYSSESAYARVSTSEPTYRRFQPPMHGSPVITPVSQTVPHQFPGLMFDHAMSRSNSIASGNPSAGTAFNQSAPLSRDESRSNFSEDSGSSKKKKIQPDSNVRVYGRGGAQNIKLKQKEGQKSESGKKSSTLRGLKKFG